VPHTPEIAGCTLHYTELGRGPAVVFLHGGGGFRFDEHTFSALSERYRLLAPSMPGFDESTPGTTTSIEDVADVVAAFIRQVADRRAHVIGESFGGGVATWLAIRHPDVVDRLVLAAPSGLRDEHCLTPSQLAPTEVYTLLYGGSPRQASGSRSAEMVARNRANSDRLHASRPDFDQALYERLPEIQAPTLVIWGTADRLIPPSHARYYEARIPHVSIVLLEGAPHVLSAAAPEQFVPAVLAHLAGGAAAPDGSTSQTSQLTAAACASAAAGANSGARSM
jgi:pimeloyl-ACP methyl ester carboxylesterase